MKRTIEEFAREALDDGPFELVIPTGPKSTKTVTPLPVSDFTYQHDRENARLADVWAKAYNAVLSSSDPGASVFPKTPSGEFELEPVEFRFRIRFGALKTQEPTESDPRAFVPEDNADYKAFRDHVWHKKPWSQVMRLMNAVDEYYDPTPASDEEKAETAQQPDGAAAGKSSAAATS